ncbi:MULTISPECIES: type 1 glutamine amidotransferase family protein [Actinomycetes]|uniref:Uncharacterized protein n=2 Tax=Actinomycetes TaxID=1760 RepID=A0ABP5YRL5_9ACTN
MGNLSVAVVAGLTNKPTPDVVIVGRRPGQKDQMSVGSPHRWLPTVDRTSAWTTSVCTGPLVLAAGALDGRRRTTHGGRATNSPSSV